jgi:hypothetical protein
VIVLLSEFLVPMADRRSLSAIRAKRVTLSKIH